MLEHDVGQLPQQVVQQHESPDRAASGGVGRRRSRHVVGARRAGGRGPAPSQSAREAPRLRAGAARSATAGVAGAARRRATMSPGRASSRNDARRRRAPSTPTAGSARLPTMTGCTNSTATWRPCAGHARRDAPHRGAGREPPGQREGGSGEVVGDRQRRGRPPRSPRIAPPRPATATWPRARPPSFGGTSRCVSTSKSSRRKLGCGSRRTSSTFWNTPPLSATTSSPVRSRDCPAVSATSRATATWNPAAIAAG